MSGTSNKIGRFEFRNEGGRVFIRDAEQNRDAHFFDPFAAKIAFDAIAMGGLDPEHLHWLPAKHETESELNLCPNPS